MIILGIDPGNTRSAFVVYDTEAKKIIESSSTHKHKEKGFHTFENNHLLDHISNRSIIEIAAIEMIESLGMPVGATVFDTCVWIGRFQQVLLDNFRIRETMLIHRGVIKLEMCGSKRAKDGNIRQALIDMIGEPGKKKTPGPTFGIGADTWQALAVAVTADKIEKSIIENKDILPLL